MPTLSCLRRASTVLPQQRLERADLAPAIIIYIIIQHDLRSKRPINNSTFPFLRLNPIKFLGARDRARKSPEPGLRFGIG